MQSVSLSKLLRIDSTRSKDFTESIQIVKSQKSFIEKSSGSYKFGILLLLFCTLFFSRISSVNAQRYCYNLFGVITPDLNYQYVSGCSVGGVYQFRVVAGCNYTFTFCSPGYSNFDSYLTITDIYGNYIMASDDYCGLSSHLNFSASTSGDFLIHVGDFWSDCNLGGCYTLAYNSSCSPIIACTSPLTNIISSAQSIIYNTSPVTLQGTSNAINAGYAWEVSPNNFDWAYIPGSNNTSFSPGALTQWAWYRRKLAEGACDTAISNVVRVSLINTVHDSLVLSGNTPICESAPVYLNSVSPVSNLSYNWTGPNGFTSTLQNPSIPLSTVLNTGVYRCEATSPAGNVFLATFYIEVSPRLTNLSLNYNQPVCEGSNLVLTASGYSGAEYQWTGPSGFTSSAYSVVRANAQTSMNGIYSLTVSTAGCGTIHRTVSVDIQAIPNPTPGSNSPVCVGNVLSLTASVPPGSTAFWQGPNGFTSALYTTSLSNAQTIMGGNYSLTVTRPGCTPVVQSANISVNQPVGSASVSTNSPVCSGNLLTVSASNLTGVLYSWSGPNGFVSSLNSQFVSNVSALNAGVYTVQLVSPGCGSATRTTNVVVLSPGSINPGSNSPVCAGGSLNLTCIAPNGSSVLWLGPNGYSNNIGNPSISSVQTIRSGVYTVTVSYPGCTPASQTTNVVIGSTVSAATAIVNNPICEGSNINLTATNLNSAVYSWTGPLGFTSAMSNPSISTVSLAAAGAYAVVISSPGCSPITRSVNAIVRSSSFSSTPGSNSPRCTGNALYLTSPAVAGAAYLWQGPNSFSSSAQNPSLTNVQALQSGDYSLTISMAGCSSSTATTPVLVYPSSASIAISSAQTICAPAALVLTGTSVAGATMSWTGPNAFTAMGASMSIPTTTVAAQGKYVYSVTTPGCGVLSKSVNILVTSGSLVTGSVSSPVCTGAPLYMSSGFISGATYQWSAPDGFSSTQQNPSRTLATPLFAGVYSLSVSVPGCGIVSRNFSVVINPCREAGSENPSETILDTAFEEFGIELYPNPTNGLTTVTIFGLKDELVQLTIMDLLGHEIHVPAKFSEIHGYRSCELDFNGVANGVYFMKVQTMQSVKIERVVVKK